MNKLISLELFFIDGKPDGMLTAEVFGWTGHILVVPRTRLSDSLKRKESSYTGVYILLGDEDEDEKPSAYIGEGEVISKRIKQHDAKKDWWTKVVLITSSANNLNKAHVKYLEARLIQEGVRANNVNLDNSTNPPLPSLNESSMANMEAFIEQLLMVLPAVQVNLFVSKVKLDIPHLQSDFNKKNNPIFELTLKSEGVTATARLEDGEFIVQKGSLARGTYIGERSKKYSYWRLYDKLVEQGVLIEQNDNKVFSESYAFSSTSAAGAVCNGRSTAGPLAWKIQGTRQTYKEWEAENLARD